LKKKAVEVGPMHVFGFTGQFWKKQALLGFKMAVLKTEGRL
jgi:hypothetical protein